MTSDLTALHALLEGDTPLNWVFTGDSITHGVVHTHGARSFVDHLHELIRNDLLRLQDVVLNTAISGWKVVQLLEDFDRRVATWHPHVVTLMIGTNDCSTTGASPIEPAEFAASVTEVVRRVRELDAIPVLQTQPAVDVLHAPERARIAEFAQAVRDVAEAEGTILVDQFARFAALGEGRQGGVPWGLMADPFHPGAAGHAVLALEIAQTLGISPEPDRDRVLPFLRAQVQAAR
ncbi:SGNH/GDSL hydrolase family protein [Microbacterium soli]|uniref:SGNH hydrolase-type esterase domain-containing protein n=1 Tax=Microbacterium soli TaxID=446075 RepID=A0ABP7N0F7_9MICO